MASEKGKKTDEGAQLGQLNFAPGSYLESTSRPLYGLLFLLPWIVVYEAGTLWVNTDGVSFAQQRVVTYIWLFRLAEWVGLRAELAWAFPGFVVVILLLCWHLASRRSWEVRLGWLGGMGIESLVLAVPLLALNAAIGSSTRMVGGLQAAMAGVLQAGGEAGAEVGHPLIARLVTSIGAGIYEELVFRLVLIGLLLMVLEDVAKVKAPVSTMIAVAVSAILFAVHHYVGVHGGRMVMLESFTAGGFAFRALAGVYFAVVFRWRGYGVTAGTHAAYNIVLKTIWG